MELALTLFRNNISKQNFKNLGPDIGHTKHPDDRHWDNQNTLPGRCLLDNNRHSGNQNLLSVDDIALDICL